MSRVAKPRKHGNRWKFSWYDATGKRRWGSCASKKEAMLELRRPQAEADAERAGARAVRDPDKRFEDLAELWVYVKRRKRSLRDDIARLKNHLSPELAGLKLTEITPARITALERRVSEKVAIGTVRQVLALLQAMLNLAVEHDWILAAPKVRLPKAPELDYEWLQSEEEMGALLSAARDTGYLGLLEF